MEGSGDKFDEGPEGEGVPGIVTATMELVGIRERLSPCMKPSDLAELMILQMKADSEQRDYVVMMRYNERKEVDKRRVDEHEEASRVREDDRNEAARVRTDERNERALDRTAAIGLISGITAGCFTMATEVNAVKSRSIHENREAGTKNENRINIVSMRTSILKFVLCPILCRLFYLNF